MTGLVMMILQPSDEQESIWEEIPVEEVQTYIKETEQEQDFPVDEPVQVAETGQCTKGISQASGEGMTYEEEQLLLKLAVAEAGNQGSDGMWLVMSVVMNRIESEDFPDSLTEVIYEPHQFSSVSDGRIDEVEISQGAIEALARIKEGDIAPEIIGFEVKASEVLDQYFARAFEYKDHRFYTSR